MNFGRSWTKLWAQVFKQQSIIAVEREQQSGHAQSTDCCADERSTSSTEGSADVITQICQMRTTYVNMHLFFTLYTNHAVVINRYSHVIKMYNHQFSQITNRNINRLMCLGSHAPFLFSSEAISKEYFKSETGFIETGFRFGQSNAKYWKIWNWNIFVCQSTALKWWRCACLLRRLQESCYLCMVFLICMHHSFILWYELLSTSG